jgi:ankyrin repeat protein
LLKSCAVFLQAETEPLSMFTEPTIFISASRDMYGEAQIAGEVIEEFRRLFPTWRRLNSFIWKDADTVWRADATLQEQIERPTDPMVVAVIVLVGERMGEPLPSSFQLPPELVLPACVRFPWSDTDVSHIPLTGTLFEYLDVRSKNDALPHHKHQPPLLVFVRGDVAKIDSNLPFDARDWGFGRHRKEIASRSGLFEDMRAYYRQLRFLATFIEKIHRPRERGTHFIDEDPEHFRQKLRDSLISILEVSFKRDAVTALKGLDAYDVTDAAIFAGRSEITHEIFQAIDRKESREDLVTAGIIIGASGAGKSSVLRAGIAAEAAEGKRNTLKRVLRVVVVTPRQLGEAPLSKLAQLLSSDDALPEIGRGEDFSGLIAHTGDRATDILLARIKEACQAAAQDERSFTSLGIERKVRLILAVDQLDEIVDATVEGALPKEQQCLLEFLIAGAKRRTFILVGTLSDARLSRWNRLIGENTEIFDYWPLANPREGLGDIVDVSFRAMSFALSSQLTVRLIESCLEIDEQRSATLPLLSVAMTRLANAALKLREDPNLNAETISDATPIPATPEFLELADIRSAIDALAERAWEEAYPQAQTSQTIQSLDVGRLFQRLVAVRLSEDKESISLLECSRTEPALLEFHPLIASLLKNRLLVETEDGRIRLVHESAVRHWGRASRWFEEAHETLRILDTIRLFASYWSSADSQAKPSMLLPAGYCMQAQRVLTAWQGDYTRVPLEFIRASLSNNAVHFVQQPDTSGRFPLAIAAHLGELELVRKYIESGAPVNVPGKDGATALHSAAQNGFLPIVAELLRAGADPNAQTAAGFTPLMSASESGSIEIIGLLVESGADVEVRNDGGWTSLHIAVSRGHLNAAGYLIEKGVPVDSSTATDHETALEMACRRDDALIAEMLLVKGADPNRFEESALCAMAQAIKGGAVACAKLLLRFGAKVDGIQQAHGTLLLTAVEEQQPEIASLLLEAGSDPNYAKDTFPYSPLLQAIRSEHQGILDRLLAAGSDVNRLQPNGATALHYASRFGKGSVRIVQSVLEAGGNPHLLTSDGQTVLHWAAFGSNEAALLLFLERGVNPNHQDRNGFTALHTAVSSGSENRIIQLLSAVTDETLEDAGGFTPLLLALAQGRKRIVDLFLEVGVSPFQTSSIGITSLAAASSGDQGIIEDLLKRTVEKERVEDLSPAITRAAQHGRMDIIPILAKWGASFDVIDEHGLSPLMYSSWRGHRFAVEILLSLGANPSLASRDGWTAIYFACLGDKQERQPDAAKIVEQLLRAGADLHHRDTLGRSALDIAEKCGAVELTALLKSSMEREIDTKT